MIINERKIREEEFTKMEANQTLPDENIYYIFEETSNNIGNG
jgi:hypothetical protein